ncbi:hypothetical protein [Streptomyces cyaneofuscatus]|uniref:hypothetical protein n=1 Tax=Streptomyces cyaneofuscatus TaxID=66883 RepID=UPI0036A2CD35
MDSGVSDDLVHMPVGAVGHTDGEGGARPRDELVRQAGHLGGEAGRGLAVLALLLSLLGGLGQCGVGCGFHGARGVHSFVEHAVGADRRAPCVVDLLLGLGGRDVGGRLDGGGCCRGRLGLGERGRGGAPLLLRGFLGQRAERGLRVGHSLVGVYLRVGGVLGRTLGGGRRYREGVGAIELAECLGQLDYAIGLRLGGLVVRLLRLGGGRLQLADGRVVLPVLRLCRRLGVGVGVAYGEQRGGSCHGEGDGGGEYAANHHEFPRIGYERGLSGGANHADYLRRS